MKTFVQIVIILLVILFGFLAYFSDRESSPCMGKARCFTGEMKEIIDGDTFVINRQKVRLALANTPEKGEKGYNDAIYFVESVCPVGSSVLVDQDDKQLISFDRIIAEVHCNGINMGEELVRNGFAVIMKDFCSRSEFGNETWVKAYGC